MTNNDTGYILIEDNDKTLIESDGRGRVSLGKVSKNVRRWYLASENEDGDILLTPAVVVPISEVFKNDK